MSIIQTVAPIKIDDLKKYFADKSTVFLIDYSSSAFKSDKLLIYISNLDVPCDLKISNRQDLLEILSAYLTTSSLVSVPFLEKMTISLLLQSKGIIPVVDQELLDTLKPQLEKWIDKLDSLPLFNMYIIKEESIKQWVIDSHKEDPTEELSGINFVSLLKHEEFYGFYQKMISQPKYFSSIFNNYMFKGKNLYHFWACEQNPMFLLTSAIANGRVDLEEYIANASLE